MFTASESKTMNHLANIRVMLKILAWTFLLSGIILSIIFLSDIPSAPSFLIVVATLLDALLPNLMAFAICYALSEIIRFLGFLWIKLEILRQKLGVDVPQEFVE